MRVADRLGLDESLLGGVGAGVGVDVGVGGELLFDGRTRGEL